MWNTNENSLPIFLGRKAVEKIRTDYIGFDNIYASPLDSSKVWKLSIVRLSPKFKWHNRIVGHHKFLM